jgi:type I restriction enzyme S subunit
MLNEADTRAKLINPKLLRNGWMKKMIVRNKPIIKKQLRDKKEWSYNIPVYDSSRILGHTTEALVNFDTIVIGRVGAYGAINFAEGPCWISDNAIYVKEYISDKIFLKFLYWLLKISDLSKFAKISAYPLISQGPIKNLEVLILILDEQNKIILHFHRIEQKIETLKNFSKQKKKLLLQFLIKRLKEDYEAYMYGGAFCHR